MRPSESDSFSWPLSIALVLSTTRSTMLPTMRSQCSSRSNMTILLMPSIQARSTPPPRSIASAGFVPPCVLSANLRPSSERISLLPFSAAGGFLGDARSSTIAWIVSVSRGMLRGSTRSRAGSCLGPGELVSMASAVVLVMVMVLVVVLVVVVVVVLVGLKSVKVCQSPATRPYVRGEDGKMFVKGANLYLAGLASMFAGQRILSDLSS